MAERILLCGENGVGKSTLGRRLAQRLSCPFLDIEDYFFPGRKPGESYQNARSREETVRALLTDLKRYDRCVLAAVKASYGREVEALLTLAVRLELPKATQMERIRKRSYEKFGDRMLPGGDLYEREEAFFVLAANRPLGQVETWLKATGLPVLRLDGARPVEENVERILEKLKMA